MLLKRVTLLLLHLFCLTHSKVVGPTSYVIGNTFNLTWNSNFSSSSTVNISLQYNDVTLMVALNVPNTGNVVSLPQFDNDPSHLLVPDNTNGTWMVSDSSTSLKSNNVVLYQPLMFETNGRVLDLGTSFSISVTLNSQISLGNYSAYLVYLNSQSLWFVAYTLQTNVTSNRFNTAYLTLTFPVDSNLNKTRNYYLVVFANGMKYSGINGGVSFNDWSNLFIPYDKSEVMITLGNNHLIPYASVPMNVTVGDELKMEYLYIALKDNYFNDGNNSLYMELQCNSSMASQYNQFGWLLDSSNMSTPMYGNYTMELYYNPMTTFDNIEGDSLYKLYSYGMIEIEHGDEIPAIVLDPNDYIDNNQSITVKKGNNIDFHIIDVALNIPVRIHADWVQKIYGKDEMHSFGNKSFTIEDRVSSDNPYKFSFTVPKEAVISNETDKQISLRLYGYDCQGNHFGYSYYLFDLKKKSHSTNKLSAGAIVGIVCAGVLICGLAAWYLAMSRHGSTSDGYSELDKD